MSALGYLLIAAGSATPTSSQPQTPTGTPSVSSCPCVTSPPAPGPGIGDTVSLAAPWQLTLPLLITIVLGLATAFGIVWTILQRHRAELRQQLWNRMQWALDAATSDQEPQAFVGMLAIENLLKADKLTTKEGGPPIKLTKYDADLLQQTYDGLE